MTEVLTEVSWERNLFVRLQDGTRLATDVYLPDGTAGPWPALMERTPYNKLNSNLVLAAKYFARRGYAVVLQDVRGRHGSEGEWYPFANEGPDGVETLEWVRRQPWCDGRVATIGLSYAACTQTSLAAFDPPGLTSQFVADGFHNYHTASMRQGGALEVRFLIYAFNMALTSREAAVDPAKRLALQRAWADLRSWLKHLPPKEGLTPLRHLPSYERWVLDIWQHGEYDEYWSSRPGYSIEGLYDQHADVPIYLLGSWYDSYARSTVTNYVELTRRKRGPIRLIMGPWIHGTGNMDLSYAGDADFGPDAALGYNDFRLRWFDAVLKGAQNGILEKPPVRIFVMGGGSGRRLAGSGKLDVGGRWRFEREWPLARTAYTPFFLQPGGGLAPTRPPGGAAPSRYAYDPEDPVPTIGGNLSVGHDIMPGGGFDQRGGPHVYGARDTLPLSSRADVLVFSTPPLEEDIEVTGAVVVTLWAASTAPDTDFTAKLIDVYPPSVDYPEGYELNIGDSIIRARYRRSREEPELLEPGVPYEFTITLYPTSVVFQKGHRIRLHVSSSNFPRFDVNPNTGGPLGVDRVTQRAVQSIFHDAARASHVILPIIPA
ncbi:MAG: CocE/NonD family hydrolase [Armatimonadetes bacterium]|nr:CocE/NonD family hydrolase [Armatimonadota bacterium]